MKFTTIAVATVMAAAANAQVTLYVTAQKQEEIISPLYTEKERKLL